MASMDGLELLISELTEHTNTVVAQICHDHRQSMQAAANHTEINVPDAYIENFVEMTVPR